jgi:hypothetical protein
MNQTASRRRPPRSDSLLRYCARPAFALAHWPEVVAESVPGADLRPEFRAARNHRIVEDQGHQLGRAHRHCQSQQMERQFGDRHLRPFDQLVMGGLVRLSGKGSYDPRAPDLPVEQATGQVCDEMPGGNAVARATKRKEIDS